MKNLIFCFLLFLPTVSLADVLVVNIWKPLPGQNQELIKNGQEARGILEKNGANVGLGMDLQGRMHVVTAFANWAEWAEFNAKLNASKNWLMFLTKVRKNPSAELEDHYLLNSPSPSDGGAGNVYQVFIWEPVLGRGDSLVSSAIQAKAIHEKSGAKVSINVDQLGNMHYVMSFDSWDSWAKFSDTPNSDFQAFMQKQSQNPNAKLIKVYTANSL